jgi:hypothetical protein
VRNDDHDATTTTMMTNHNDDHDSAVERTFHFMKAGGS